MLGFMVKLGWHQQLMELYGQMEEEGAGEKILKAMDKVAEMVFKEYTQEYGKAMRGE